MRHGSPLHSRLNSVTALAVVKQPIPTLKLHSLWQARSVRSMLVTERKLSAWSPQISGRNRRKHYPRVNGIPLPRKYLTFKARRDRRVANAKRLRRCIPQIRYTDHGRVKLQYALGSVGAAYLRYRRIYRGHTDHTRW